MHEYLPIVGYKWFCSNVYTQGKSNTNIFDVKNYAEPLDFDGNPVSDKPKS